MSLVMSEVFARSYNKKNFGCLVRFTPDHGDANEYELEHDTQEETDAWAEGFAQMQADLLDQGEVEWEEASSGGWQRRTVVEAEGCGTYEIVIWR